MKATGKTAHPALSAGHTGAIIMACCGVYTLLTLVLPRPDGFHAFSVLLVAIVALVGSAAVWLTPWDRLPDWPRLLLGPASALLITWHNIAAGLDPFKYGMFYFMIFLWLGLFERRGWSVKLAPFVAACYLLPLVLTGASAPALLSVIYAVPLYVTVGEVLAWRTEVLRAAREELERMAGHDRLTGLPNRRVLDRALRETTGEAALLFVDLNGFKAINDRYGHEAGDEVLTGVAGAIRDAVRTDDLPCRLAGDEFVVLVRGADPVAGAQQVAARLQEGLARVPTPDGLGARASIGVAGGDPATLISRADQAMYEAKRTGAALVTAGR
ncbi:GGDEF domain-containing protein [Actinoplanes sp. CA-142083]|uniref:GGDEF domain-containing protein n=1 Tax=Actinoplanes sp. CA-142083 TaxID=3239903 RepID=UPI003D94FBED